MQNFFNSKQVAIFSDIHLGIHKNSSFWHSISLDWADWFISDLKSRNITDIVFCGDLFHVRSDISVSTLHVGTKLLDKFKEFNLILIIGNHDCFLKDSSAINSISQFKNWSNVTVIDTATVIESHNKKFACIPWGVELDQIPNSDVIFGHFAINYFKNSAYYVCDTGENAQDLLNKTKLVITGHFHLRDDRSFANGRVLYVGNPFQMDFGDSNTSKGYYILDVDKLDTVYIENTLSPKHFVLILSDLVAETTLTQPVLKSITGNFIKLKINMRISTEDTDILITKIKQYNPISIVIEYEGNYCDYNIDSERKDLSGIDIEQAIIEFIDLMDINNKPEIIKHTTELYKSLSK